jgi:uncharacterized protein with HEPN domain
LESANKILKYSSELKSYKEMESNDISFDAILMNFIVIGEMANKLSDEFKSSCPDTEWRKIIAFRNFIAHEYFGIDPEEVWEIIHSKLPQLIKDLEHQ